MTDLIAWAERFIATPSESKLGNEAIARLAAELLAALGLPARVESALVAGTRHHAVTCDVGPADAADGLLLVTHLDTVPPGPAEAWTATGGDPFRATHDGDRLYGLGSADAKVDFVCKATALARIDRARLRAPVRLVGTFGEEVGLLGARWLVERGLARGFVNALIGEPSELAAVHAHKGYAVFEARIALARIDAAVLHHGETRVLHGVAAHSSSPALGSNAIVAALEALASSDAPGFFALDGGTAVNVVPDRCALGIASKDDAHCELDTPAYGAAPLIAFLAAWRRFQAALAQPRDADFDPAESVSSLGRASLADGHAVLRFDVRPIPGGDAEALVAPLREVAEITCVRANPPLMTPRDSALVRAVEAAQRAAGAPVRVTTKATCTEAGLLAQTGLHALVLGPGPSVGNVHKPNEHTRVSELHRAVELYRDVIARLVCAGDAPCS
jgi:acetylornithine deacetylase/succinyl-diaminopimelate desuccinylase-like protein